MARVHASQDAASRPARPSSLPTAQTPPADLWGDARRNVAVALSTALERVSRSWVASQIPRATSLVERWFQVGEADKHPAPLALLVALRSDGRGYVLSREEFERVVDELRRVRGGQ